MILQIYSSVQGISLVLDGWDSTREKFRRIPMERIQIRIQGDFKVQMFSSKVLLTLLRPPYEFEPILSQV
jgi:hypothetical protein